MACEDSEQQWKASVNEIAGYEREREREAKRERERKRETEITSLMEEHKARTSYLMLQQVKSAKPMSTYFSYLCNVREFLILPDENFAMVQTLILYSQIDNSRYVIRESVSDKTCSVSRGTCSDDHQICLGEYVFGISRLP